MVAIFIVLAILVLVAIDAGLEWRKARAAPLLPQPLGSAWEPVIPAGLFFHPGHTWTEIQPLGQVRVGLDDFVLQALGRPDRVVMRQPGEEVRQGEAMLTLEQAGRQLVLPAPVSGEIEDINEHLAGHPESLGDSTYGKGWVYTLKPKQLGLEVNHLKVAENASAWFEGEKQRFADWIGERAGLQLATAMQDGGLPVSGALGQLNEVDWQDFQLRFLDQA